MHIGTNPFFLRGGPRSRTRRRLRLLLGATLFLLAAPGSGQALPVAIDFEDRPVGEVVFDQYAARGVTFPGKARIVVPSSGTQSGTKALTSRYPATKEFDSSPLVIQFNAAQQRIKLHAGVDEPSFGIVGAELRAFEAGNVQVDVATASLGVGPRSVTMPLEVETPTASIRRVELKYTNAEFEVIDNLEFDSAGTPPPPDTQAPAVNIIRPAAGEAASSQGGIGLDGTVTENRQLKKLTLQIGSQPPFDLSFSGTGPTFRFGPTSVGPLAPGVNLLRVRAEDFAGNAGEDSVSVTYAPLPEGLNLYARGLEITQGIQEEVVTRSTTRYRDNLVPFYPRNYVGTPLVEGKATVVRLYAGVEGAKGPVHAVPGLLYGYRNGQMLPESPLRGFRQIVTVDPSSTIEAQRDDADQTWNFVLPPSWSRGTISLLAEVNAGAGQVLPECDGCNDRANDFADIIVRFNETGVLLVRPWQVVWNGQSPSLSVAGPTSQHFDGLRARYPIAQEDVMVMPYASTLTTGSMNCGDILDDLATADFFHVYPNEGPSGPSLYQNPGQLPGPLKKQVVIGLLPQIPGLSCGGMAYMPPDGFWEELFGAWGGGRVSIATVASSVVPAHEIGHSFGLNHAGDSHGECGGGGCERDFPHGHGGIGATGFDIATMSAIPAGVGLTGQTHAHDMMSYGSPGNARWISVTNYHRLYNKLRVSGTQSARSLASLAASDATNSSVGSAKQTAGLLVSGVVRTDGSAKLRSLFEIDRSRIDGLPDRGSYSIVLGDRTGRALFRRSFEPVGTTGHHEPGQMHGADRRFTLVLPRLAATARLELQHEGRVLASVRRSPHVPSVRLLDPDGGELLPARGSRVVRWRASDTDGDELGFVVEYSRNAGRAWRPLAVNLRGTSTRVPLAMLEGSSRALIRVRASDGLNTSRDTSDRAFRVANKRPAATIFVPARRAVYAAGTDVVLQGAAVDLEDGSLLGARLRWISNRDGLIGSGSSVTFRSPSVGRHVITLRAVDKANGSATATVEVVIETNAAGERTAPTVSELSPGPQAPPPERSTSVSVRFSEDVAGVNAHSFRLMTAGGRKVPARVEYVRAERKATLQPARRLPPNGQYRVVLTAQITDLAGNAVVTAPWTFRTTR